MNYVGFYLSIVVFLVIYTLILKKFGLEKTKSEKIIEIAKKNGYVINARLKESKWIPGDPTSDMSVPYYIRNGYHKNIYEYVVNNRTYIYRCETDRYPNDNITLFYNNEKPEQAYQSGEQKKKGCLFWIFDVIVPGVVLILLLKVFGILQL